MASNENISKKTILLLSILAVICPVIATAIMMQFEPEFVEALCGGLLLGCIAGSILGVVSLILNKRKSKIVTVLSCIPMCPLIIYLILFIPYLLYN